MPKPRQQLVQITAWSYSRLNTYDTCPAKAKFNIVQKIKEPGNETMSRGSRVHDLAAAFVSRKMPRISDENSRWTKELKAATTAKRVPEELETFEYEFLALRKEKTVLVEQEWAFDREWRKVGWFDGRVFLRIKVDVHYLEVTKARGAANQTTVHVKDYKTGKESESHALQRSLYALGALLVYPDAAKVDISHWYLDQGKESKKSVWTAADLPALQKEWLDRVTPMLRDTTFAPTPSRACAWCFYRNENKEAGGGQCEF